jgi:hypothetical protein
MVSVRVLIVSVGATVGETVTVTATEVAVAGEAQVEEDVSTQVTTDPVTSVELMKVLLLVPTLVVPTFHWKVGLAPPFVICAVKVSRDPRQIDVPVGCIVIVGA